MAAGPTDILTSSGARSCVRCGSSARVCILRGYRAGEPVYRNLCLGCADREPLSDRRSPGWASLLMFGGALLVFFALSADVLLGVTQPGFGWRQKSALILGFGGLLLGGLLRIDPLGMCGFVLVVLAVATELGGTPGYGWKQIGAGAAGLIFVAAGWWMARRHSHAVPAGEGAACNP